MGYFSKAIFIAGMALCFCLSAFSQDISLKANNVTVKEAMARLKKASGYSFVFSSTDVDTKKQISVSAQDATIEEVVKQILKGQNGLTYEIQDKKIIIKKGSGKPGRKVKVTGRVIDAKGEAVIGATIRERGTTNGVITNIDGNFTLNASSNSVLEIAYIGYKTELLSAVSGQMLNVTMKEDAQTLDEVVVTALGIKREQKALGYSSQKVVGESLSKVKTIDIGTSLTGKVAGLNVLNSTEFNSAPSLKLRGANPLLVIDGVPFGNSSLSDISSDDVESMDILKGAAASALYGARGENGVIMITTKKGMEEGMHVDINSSTMFNAGYLTFPEAQSSYSTGVGGKYAPGSFVWGDKLDIGRTAEQYDPFTYKWEETPLISKGKDNYKNFLQQGFMTNNNISISQKGKYGSFRTSLSHVYNRGQYPNQTLNKITYTLNGTMKWKKFTFEGGANYNKRITPNYAGSGYGNNGYIYNMVVWTGSEYDLRDYRNYWIKKDEKQNWMEGYEYNNPYFLAYENTYRQNNDKLKAYLSMKYDILPWLNLSIRTGADMYSNRYEYRTSVDTRMTMEGYFGLSKDGGFSVNNDAILSAKHKWGDFTFDGLLGGTLYYYYDEGLSGSTEGGLSIPGYYSLQSSVDAPSVSSDYSSKQVNSLYGKFSVAWKNAIYIDVTGRNDWSSTLPKETRSYFYPSVAGSVVLSEFFKAPSWLDFWKVRGAWTVTKSDMDIYDINSVYSVNNSAWGSGITSAAYPGSIRSSIVKPETSSSYELGTAFNVLDNRLRVDLTYYNKREYNLTDYGSVSSASGFSSTLLNTKEERARRGWELTVIGQPVKTKDWDWTIVANWARDRYIYLKLDSEYSEQYPWVTEGSRIDWYGVYDWIKDSEGNIVHQAGLPMSSDYRSQNNYEYPDWIWGVNNSIRYKNLTLSFSFDGRVGGMAFNETEASLWYSGAHPDSDNQHRYDEVVNGLTNFIGNGVKVVSGNVSYDSWGRIVNDTRVFAPNDVPVSYEAYTRTYNPWPYYAYAAFQHQKSCTFFKLRDLSVTYEMPKNICEALKMRSASISLIGQNLLLWTKEFKYADPDVDSDNLNSPSQRYLGFNINLSF